jgi:hypothetical protein
MPASRKCLLLILLVLASGLGAVPVAASDSQTPVAQNSPEPTAPASPAEAESPESRAFSATFDATAASKYLFQGIDYSTGRGVVQPDLVATMGSYSATAWTNYQPDFGNFNEIDLSLKYTHSMQRLSISPGYTYLRYPHRVGWDPSQELTLDLGLQTLLSPSLSLHYDFDSGKGLYATLGMSHEVRAPVTVGANVFYQGNYYGMSGFPAMELKASATLLVGAISITPSISNLVTWQNRTFRGEAAVPSTWLFSFNVARPIKF